MEELVQSMGFSSLDEFNEMVCSVDLATPEKLAKFKDWQANDGTKEGLLKFGGELNEKV